MGVESQFIWVSILLVVAVVGVLLFLIFGIVLFGFLAIVCEWREFKFKRKNSTTFEEKTL